MTLIQRIDALLPQTQCGKCGHPGCKPYAQGIVDGEAINKCPPGGEETIAALAQLLKVPILALDTERGSASPQVAFIREAECIGCTKCIQACPVDAILGAAKMMHTVIVDECTGCDLCVAPCPVDCIDMLPLPPTGVIPIVGGLAVTEQQTQARTRKRNHARHRFEARNARLRHEEQQRHAERLARVQKPASQPDALVSPLQSAIERIRTQKLATNEDALKKARSTLAMSRAQLNKSLKAFGHPPIAEQAAQLVEMQKEFEAAEQALASLQDPASVPAQTPVAPRDDSSLKRAKIQLAMARAAYNKALSAQATAEQLATLQTALHAAEMALDSAMQPSSALMDTRANA
ncbi:MAG TPA: electron transport complex subunit RsxB [Pseudomonas sp.]|jgi:electron transport complex protein RnfB|uniref:electron transport complex subunit RsxB n=1 Tax=Pseudomonas sp. TaxID=306 RepID=UPI002ED8D5A5